MVTIPGRLNGIGGSRYSAGFQAFHGRFCQPPRDINRHGSFSSPSTRDVKAVAGKMSRPGAIRQGSLSGMGSGSHQIIICSWKAQRHQSTISPGNRPIMANRNNHFSISTVAGFLDVSEMTVRRLIAEGELDAITPRPRCIRISQSSLDRFLKRKTIRTRSTGIGSRIAKRGLN